MVCDVVVGSYEGFAGSYASSVLKNGWVGEYARGVGEYDLVGEYCGLVGEYGLSDIFGP